VREAVERDSDIFVVSKLEQTMDSVVLRPAQQHDSDFLRELYSSTRVEEMASWGWSDAQQKAFLRLQFEAQQRHHELAYEGAEDCIITVNDRPAGRLLVLRSDVELRLVDIALLPDYRNRGAGTIVIRMLQEEAAIGGKPLRLHVSYLNPALRLYRRLGFVEIGDTGTDYFMEWTRR
jgi:ribosomal protein S18 acetylase RimI-like enzyme